MSRYEYYNVGEGFCSINDQIKENLSKNYTNGLKDEFSRIANVEPRWPDSNVAEYEINVANGVVLVQAYAGYDYEEAYTMYFRVWFNEQEFWLPTGTFYYVE